MQDLENEPVPSSGDPGSIMTVVENSTIRSRIVAIGGCERGVRDNRRPLSRLQRDDFGTAGREKELQRFG